MTIASIIMAAYNSEKEIDRALQSVREQDVNQEEIEILVVDGGSTDKTREIAYTYGARVLDNPKRLPEPAKMIGLRNAKGKYVFIMDTDEKMFDRTILQKRLDVLKKYKYLKAYTGGFQTPILKKKISCLDYINKVGDPFTCFVYKTYLGDSMYGIIKRRGQYDEKLNCYVAKFQKDDIIPIGDSVTGLDREFLFENYSEFINKDITTATLFDWTVRDTGYVAHIEGDLDYHYSISSYRSYFKKLKFRVINNIFDVNGSGYSSRARSNAKLRYRKYLFPFYTISVVIPIYHAIYMSVVYKNWNFLMHPVFCWYVLFQIIYQYGKKLLGIKSNNTSYAR